MRWLLMYPLRYCAYRLALALAWVVRKKKEITIATCFAVSFLGVAIGVGWFIHPGLGVFAIGALIWLELKGPWFRS